MANPVAIWLFRALVALGVMGTLSSTVFLVMAIVAALRYLRHLRAAQQPTPLPPVSIIKPLCGMEPRLEENLETYFTQDYPTYEILFAMRTPQDPALQVVEIVRAKYPSVPARVIFSGQPRHSNPKITSVEAMVEAAQYDHLVISDSDVRVTPDFLRKVIPPLTDPKKGLSSCLYRGVPTRSFWSRLEALEMSVEMPSGVLVADMLEGMKFALGIVMVTRKDVLEKIGGIGQTGDYFSDDFVLGNVIDKAGYHVVLSTYIAEHVLVDQTFRSCFSRQLRWNRSTRYSRPKGHVGTGLTYAMPFGIVGAIGALGLRLPWLALGIFAFAALRGIVQGLLIGGAVLHLRNIVSESLLYPLRDLMGFCAWAGSFTGRRFFWRGEWYHFEDGGKLCREAAAVEASAREQVRV